MTVKIKPKRGTGAPSTSDLDTNEIAMDMAAGKIYVDNGSAVVVLAEANPTADIDLTGSLSVPAIDGGTGADKTIDIDTTGSDSTARGLQIRSGPGSGGSPRDFVQIDVDTGKDAYFSGDNRVFLFNETDSAFVQLRGTNEIRISTSSSNEALRIDNTNVRVKDNNLRVDGTSLFKDNVEFEGNLTKSGALTLTTTGVTVDTTTSSLLSKRTIATVNNIKFGQEVIIVDSDAANAAGLTNGGGAAFSLTLRANNGDEKLLSEISGVYHATDDHTTNLTVNDSTGTQHSLSVHKHRTRFPGLASLKQLTVATSDPGSPANGDMYFKSDTKFVRYYDGSSFANVTPQAGDAFVGSDNDMYFYTNAWYKVDKTGA
jgi:phage baseplate assembly protein gpV